LRLGGVFVLPAVGAIRIAEKMNDLVPSEPRIDRPALERIIQRAAELQTKEREIGDGLSDTELMHLGEEVGILPQHLKKALSEERSRELAAADRGIITQFLGPRRVVAQRTVPGKAADTEAALRDWMSEGELLQVKRRYPDRTSWERREGGFTSLRRAFGGGGRKYVLASAAEVVTRVIETDERHCHVQLVADLANKRNGSLIGSSILVGGGATTTGIALVLGVMVPVAVIPIVLSAPIAALVARSHRNELEKFQVALEQILDRLEHEEIAVKQKLIGPDVAGVGRIAQEIRKNLGI
jgi:hypothetical protein